MGPRQLRSFIAIAEELHFGRAAALVHLSQPALSLQIRGIEEELGVQLLIRDRRKTGLTPAGRIFLNEARELVQRTEAAIALTRRAALGEVGILRIGFISTAAAMIMPQLVKQFRTKHQHVDLDLRNVLTSDQVVLLQERKLDVGFLRVPLPTPPDIRLRVIHREPFVLLLPANHPLASVKDLKVSDCQGADFVMYSRKMAPGFHDQLMNILHTHGVTPNVVQEAAEMYTLISLVSAGMGIAIAPASIQSHHVENVVVRELREEKSRSEIAIAWNKDHVSTTAQLFLKIAFEGRPRKQKSSAAAI
ncbi:LysR family transcriptional regulator [Granulicella arctica]|uniref:DNA-binding transcriptional LysR family regulator n=1 Tax=Granulicella arctica TaxID=940613 RepID=A0A7Y9TG62_9BACT|nr:LysR family transcriptional regulator [Granulicella arctica]NYF79556.1 DNA-binding transcriptional LysR family regulator [Granulicella arctica]